MAASGVAPSNGTVIVNFGRNLLLETAAGELIDCTTRGRSLRPVCGDEVTWVPAQGRRGTVTGILPRRSTLIRHDARLGQRVLAANVTRMVIVCAVEPAPDPSMLDRYCAGAEALGIPALIGYNKVDLAAAETAESIGGFADIGYPVLAVSARCGTGMAALHARLKGQRSIVVGPSGVGKSSLVESLLPDRELRTAALSAASGQGRHTTTTTRLYRLPGGGDIIDSPGVRDFRLWPMPVRDLARAFREFRPYLDRCRFHNCRHLAEPGCAVAHQVGAGTIATRRYESYRLLAERTGALP